MTREQREAHLNRAIELILEVEKHYLPAERISTYIYEARRYATLAYNEVKNEDQI